MRKPNSMEEKSKAILAGFTGGKKRSQLAPHRELISKLHQRGCPFSEIARLLSENLSLTVAPSTVFRFLARIEKEESKPRKTKPRKEKPHPIMPTVPVKAVSNKLTPPSDEIRQRITALKQQTPQTKPDTKRFNYNPDQPLHLVWLCALRFTTRNYLSTASLRAKRIYFRKEAQHEIRLLHFMLRCPLQLFDIGYCLNTP